MKTDILGKVLDIIIAACVMFLIPLIYFGQKQDAFVQSNLYETTTNLIDNVSTRGYLSKDMYDGYIKKLDTYGMVFNIELEQKIRVLEPEYRFKTPDEIKDEWDNNWSGENNYTYIPVSTEKPIVNEIIEDGNVNKETNHSILQNAINGPADPNHVHTAECYDGHIHSGTKSFTHTHKHTAYCKTFTALTYVDYTCRNCGKYNLRFVSSYYWDDATNSVKLGSSWGGTTECYDCGSRNVGTTKYYYGYGYSCHYTKDLDGDGYDDIVGTTETYEYKASSPQNVNRADHIDGCYSYHKANYLSDYEKVSAYGTYYYDPVDSVISRLRNNGYKNYCRIPEVYKFGIGENSYYAQYYVTYRAVLQEDGTVLLKYSDCSSNISYYYTYDFPKTLTIDEAISTFNSYVSFQRALLKYTSMSFGSEFEDHWDYSANTLTYDYVICDHTDSNRWVQTCGFSTDATHRNCTGNLVHKTSISYKLSKYGLDNDAMYLDYQVYECNTCTKDIVTLNLRGGYGDNKLEQRWIAEVDRERRGNLERYLTIITDRVRDENKVNGNPTSGFEFKEAMNRVLSYVSSYASFIKLSESTYKDKTNVIKDGKNYYELNMTKYMNNGALNTKTVSHTSIRAIQSGTGKNVCNEIIKQIIPTHPNQVVYLNDDIIRCATAIYLDGSTIIVLCDTTYRANTIGENFMATLTYVGKDSVNTTKTFTSTVVIKVIAKNKVCSNNHTYRINGNGTDPGCPYCREWLANLTVYTPSSKQLTMYKGTTLKENGVMLLAIYLDGRKEYLTDNYVNNLDKNYVGVQTVTVSYKGMNDTMKVAVKRNVKQCNVCFRYYELHPDNSDPGCPYCASLIPVFTGNVMEYYSIKTTEEILKELYDGRGKYYFTRGDYLKIDVKNRTFTNAMNMLKTLYSSDPYKILLTYGNKIRDTGQ